MPKVELKPLTPEAQALAARVAEVMRTACAQPGQPVTIPADLMRAIDDSVRKASEPAIIARRRMEWLHSRDAMNVDGYEWGIFRVKWENGRAVEVLQTLSDCSDLDAAMTPTLRHDANDEDPHVMSALNAGIKRDPPPTAGVPVADGTRAEGGEDGATGVQGTPAHSKSEYKCRKDMGDPNVLPPVDGVKASHPSPTIQGVIDGMTKLIDQWHDGPNNPDMWMAAAAGALSGARALLQDAPEVANGVRACDGGQQG